MSPVQRRSRVPVAMLALLVASLAATGCTKPVTTNVAPPMAASLEEDQEIVGLVLQDGSEQLFDEPGPVLQNGVWVGTSQGQTVRIPASDVTSVTISERKTNWFAIAIMAAIGATAIIIAADQR